MLPGNTGYPNLGAVQGPQHFLRRHSAALDKGFNWPDQRRNGPVLRGSGRNNISASAEPHLLYDGTIYRAGKLYDAQRCRPNGFRGTAARCLDTKAGIRR
jgi:hypothetical protein